MGQNMTKTARKGAKNCVERTKMVAIPTKTRNGQTGMSRPLKQMS